MATLTSMTAARYETLRVGLRTAMIEDLELCARIYLLRGSDARFYVFSAMLEGPFATQEQAQVHAETTPSVELSWQVAWRDSVEPQGPDEHACPVCRATTPHTPRYPHTLCVICDLEAVDAQGRSLIFYNTSATGGFAGCYADDSSPYESDLCFVRSIPCRAQEHRFGGVVIQPLESD